jgi:hypothetical protein
MFRGVDVNPPHDFKLNGSRERSLMRLKFIEIFATPRPLAAEFLIYNYFRELNIFSEI